MDKKPSTVSAPGKKKRRDAITQKEMEEILSRARQTVKPIVNRESADEIVGEDLLNFRMKASFLDV